jgi:elongation factor Ts
VLAKGITALVNFKAPRDVDEALTLPFEGGNLGEKLVAAVAKIGEKISFRRFARLETPAGAPGMIVPYIHAGGKIGVLVAVSGADRSNAAVAGLVKDLAMQVAAANPAYIGRSDVPAAVIEREKTIYREQARASGKPDKILDKIADGKLEKYFGDFCLVEQAFIKDPDRKVSQLLADVGKAAGATITVSSFARFQVGEGMEKRSDDLAAEVAKQLGQG